MSRWYRAFASELTTVVSKAQAGFLDANDKSGEELLSKSDWKATRPRLPALLLFALAFWFSTAFFFGAFRVVGIEMLWAIGAASFAASVVVGCALVKTRKARILFLLVLGMLLGVANSAFNAALLKSANVDAIEGCSYFVLTSDSQHGSRGSYAQADALLPDGSKAHVRVYLDGDVDVLAGRVVKGAATVSELRDDAAERAWGQGIVVNVYLANAVVLDGVGIGSSLRDLRTKAIEALAGFGDASLFMQAILVGYRPDLYDSELYQAVKVDGLAHLVAVSGAHLVIVVSMVGALLARLPISRKALLAAQLILLVAYLVVTAFPVSACRAAIMSLVSLGSILAKRRTFSLQALGLCVVVIVASDVTCAASYSFVLSAASVLGIALFLGFFSSWLQEMLPGAPKTITDLVSVTLSSNVATIPLSAAWFSQVSAISVLSNLVAAPLFSFFCAAGLLVVCGLVVAEALIGGWLAGLLDVLLNMLLALAQLFCGFLRILSCIPFASFPVSMDMWMGVLLAVTLVILIWLIWPGPKMAHGWFIALIALVLVIVCQVLSPAFAGKQIIMLDVGQGDAFVIRDGSKAMLIDTGTNDAQLLQGLARHGVYKLDAVLITHPDDDHCGSLAALSGVVPVRRVLVAKDLLRENDESCKKLLSASRRVAGDSGVLGLKVGDRISFGKFELEVVWPDGFSDSGGNQDSLVVQVSCDVDSDGIIDGSALFCGDAERETLESCMKQGRLKPVDVLKVGHHGSKVSLDPDLMRFLCPKIGLISVGADNRYGHPSKESLDCLSSVGAKAYRTDLMGDVTLEFFPNKIQVRTQRAD